MKEKELLEKHGFRFQKKYGQNFLYDPKIPAKIAQNCTLEPAFEGETRADAILEIGPGAGILTRELAKRFRRVLAVEIDETLLPVLEEALRDFPNAHVLCGDIMQVDLAPLVAQISENGKYPVSVCANLPYYITTPVLMKLIESQSGFRTVTVMVQKEVAKRLCAAPGGADYGAITAVLGLYGRARKLFDVPAGCFVPRPKVDSAVVRLELDAPPRYGAKTADNAALLIKAAFGQRRKTLVNALSTLGDRLVCPDKDALAAAIASLGLSPDVRGECLAAEDYVRLAEKII